MDWDDFRFVQAVAQRGSVRGAGELLQVHGSTVARHVDQLEQRVGVRLFARTAKGMEMTPVGARVIAALDHVAAELDGVERTLQSLSQAPDAPVRVCVSGSLARYLVIPHLARFQNSHQEIVLNLITAGHPEETLQQGGAEIALWFTDQPPPDLVGRPLGSVMAGAYASHRYLDLVDWSAHPERARWIVAAGADGASARVWTDCLPGRPAPERAPLTVDDDDLAVAAVEADLGVALLPCLLGDAAGLERLPGAALVPYGSAWLFSRPESRGNDRVQQVSEFVRELFEAGFQQSEVRAGLDGRES